MIFCLYTARQIKIMEWFGLMWKLIQAQDVNGPQQIIRLIATL